jgi:hypothetical protein
MRNLTANIPNYVLIDGNHRVAPLVTPLHSGTDCDAVYGFSSKELYDRFSANSKRALKPYPLVARYLKKLIDESDDRLTLLIIDATGPDEPFVQAATVEAVLDAKQNKSPRVVVAFRLLFDEDTRAYRVDEEFDREDEPLDAIQAKS